MRHFGIGRIPGRGESSLTMHFDSSRHTSKQEVMTRTSAGHDDVTEDCVSFLMGNAPWHHPSDNNHRGGLNMRFKSFARKKINGDRTEVLPFQPEHYRKAGVPYSPFSGMPVLEAHEIVNDLNRSQAEHQFVYYLAA
jgi:hypothetical protein